MSEAVLQFTLAIAFLLKIFSIFWNILEFHYDCCMSSFSAMPCTVFFLAKVILNAFVFVFYMTFRYFCLITFVLLDYMLDYLMV